MRESDFLVVEESFVEAPDEFPNGHFVYGSAFIIGGIIPLVSGGRCLRVVFAKTSVVAISGECPLHDNDCTIFVHRYGIQ